MNKKNFNLLTNMFFYLGVSVSLFAIGKTYYDRSVLPEGVCPVNDNRFLMYLGIISLIIHVIASYLGEKVIHKER
ncbi:hypothetical protein SH2C18_06180 [Clostridium sediminicola]|uniref:hypothetical protein n=1 Tax=Clostridium sediminicola TaxID=3114879 RepID=UPI0031F2552B